MKRLLKLSIISAVVSIAIAGTHTVSALPVSGTLSSAAGQIVTTGKWNELGDNFWINWNIQEVGSEVLYTYRMNIPGSPGLSHWILELSSNFASGDIRGATGPFGRLELRSDTTSPKRWGDGYPGNAGNPGWPSGVAVPGIKFDNAEGTGVVEFSFYSNRLPMEGSFYAKGGQAYAYNTGLAGGEHFILVPDTKKNGNGPHEAVPEPGTMGLLGVGLLLFGVVCLKRRASNQ